jgi:hypothetical protein
MFLGPEPVSTPNLLPPQAQRPRASDTTPRTS